MACVLTSAGTRGPALRLMRRLAALTLLAAMIIAAPRSVEARSLAEVAASKILRVVVYDDNMPFSFRRADGQMTGIDVEIAGLLAKALDAELELMPRPARDDIDADLTSDVLPNEPNSSPPGDVLMHVPIDRQVAARNSEISIGQPYFEERFTLAYDPVRTGTQPSFEMFREKRIAVESGTLADYFVTFAYEGALRPNIVHYASLADAIGKLQRNEVSGVLALRSRIEATVAEAKATVAYAELTLPGIAAPRWPVGIAVKESATDLADFLGGALATLKASGALEAISAKYGVRYAPVPAPPPGPTPPLR